MVRVIGLDLGTTMGYAWTDTGAVVGEQSGTMDFRPKRHEGGGFRYIRFKSALHELCEGSDEAVIFYEEVVYHRGADASHVYGGFMAVLHAFGDEHGVGYSGVPIGTIKKRATGSGRADKGAMVRAAMREWSVDATHDQADAMWVLQCGLDSLHGRVVEEKSDDAWR